MQPLPARSPRPDQEDVDRLTHTMLCRREVCWGEKLCLHGLAGLDPCHLSSLTSFQKPPGMNLRDWVMSHQEHEDMGTKPLIPTHRLTDCKQKLRALLAALVSHLGFTQ